MNHRLLPIAIVLLLTLYGLIRLLPGQRSTATRTNLIEIDTASVTSIVIDHAPEAEELTLKREKRGWIVSNGTLSIAATSGAVDSLLSELVLIRARRSVAGREEQWPEFGVDSRQGTRVRVYEGRSVTEDFFVGCPSSTRRMRPVYIRLAEAADVFAVADASLSALRRRFAAYRDPTLIRLPGNATITAIDYLLPDSIYGITLNNGRWLLDGQFPLDSAAVTDYIRNLHHLRGEAFADDFDELSVDQLEHRRIILRGRGFSDPVIIDLYRDSLRDPPFVVRSSQHPRSFFAGDSTGLVSRLFLNIDSLRHTGG